MMPGAHSLPTHLREYWYIAAETAELRSRPLPKTILGERLVLYRQADGQPAALIDRCAHRNMALSRGRVVQGQIECPYHGWRYGADGRCVAIPALPAETAPPETVGIRSYAASERDGYVWVYMGGQKPAVPPPGFAHYGASGWTAFRMQTRFAAGAFSCLENFLDCPHTVYVHRRWFRSADSREVRAQVTRSSDSVKVEFCDERDAGSVVSRLLFPRGQKMVHTDRFLMPATSRVDYDFGPNRRFIITSQCTPISDDETEVYTVIVFRFGGIGPLVRLFFKPLAQRIIRQDVAILKAQARQLERFGGAQFMFVESDLIGPLILELWQKVAAGHKDNGAKTDALNENRREVLLRF